MDINTILDLFAPFVDTFGSIADFFSMQVGSSGFTVLQFLIGGGIFVYIGYQLTKWLIDILP